jgi:hypothetical protein
VVIRRGAQEVERALISGEEKHPADEIGKSLLQAGGILTSISNCFDRPAASFAIGTPFIAEAIIAVEGILAKANESLAKLYESYDLSKIEVEKPVVQSPIELPLQSYTHASQNEEAGADPAVNQDDTGYLGYFGRQDQASRLASKLDSILEKLPTQEYQIRPEDMIEQPAQNYDELLEKLTAMTDAAAHQSNDPNGNLLPVLESLRADVLRMRAVA